MLNTDPRAAAWITSLNDLDNDDRNRAQDKAFLTVYHTKLGSEPTTEREDLEVLRILKDFFINKVRRAGP